MSFNLTSEPWIPCELHDGTVVELSTVEVLSRAHELRAILASSPLEVAALHRHLLAVLHRVYAGPESLSAWAEIARPERFDEARVAIYLERVADRMDLFHPERPFAQTRGLVEQFGISPIDALGFERSSWGSGRELFQHRNPDAAIAMTPAEAARALLAHHTFTTGGLVKKPGEPTSATAAPLTKAAMVLLRGRSLFETLLANLLIYNPEHAEPFAAEQDAPSWEQEPPPRKLAMSKEPKLMPRGWLDLLTWLSRRIELVESEGLVTGFVRAVGKGIDPDFEAIGDPMVTYRLDDKRGFVPIGIHPTRSFWRNASALFESNRDGARFRRPQSIDLVSSAEVQEILHEDIAFEVELFGIAAYQSRIDDMRTECVYAQARLFDDAEAFEAVNEVLDFAEKAVGALRHALQRGYARYLLSAGDRQPEGKDLSALAKSLGAEPAAFARLGQHFDVFLRELAEDAEAASGSFRQATEQTIRDCFEAATSGGQSTGSALKARVMGQRLLNIDLAKLRKNKDSAESAPEVRA